MNDAVAVARQSNFERETLEAVDRRQENTNTNDEDEETEATDTSTPAAAANPSFPHSASSTSLAHLELETKEEREYDLKLSDLDPKKLSMQQRTALVHVVACCLPRSALGSGIRHQTSDSAAANSNSSTNERDAPVGAELDVAACWELQYLTLLLKYFELDSLLLHALQPLLGRGVDSRLSSIGIQP